MNEEIQGKLFQYQQLQQQVQAIGSQKYQMEMQMGELDKTLEELKELKKGTPIYKSIGSLLVKKDDKDALVKELEDQKETVEVRVKTLTKQEKSLKESFESLQEELTNALQGSQDPQDPQDNA
ncbi:MAG: prefoldin subunit beta [Thermoplasmata archaeon]|nr:prefoldin subunit beta [Thermoplasmata archaeon]